jgi:hypothetical protein
MRAVIFIFIGAAFACGIVGHAEAQSATITFDNRSGEPASVKLIGPSKPTAEVPNGQFRTVSVAYGHYYFVIRYGSGQYQYIYAKSDPFHVLETPTQHEVFIVTLHHVPILGLASASAPRHRVCFAKIERATHKFSFGLTTTSVEMVAMRCSSTEFL